MSGLTSHMRKHFATSLIYILLTLTSFDTDRKESGMGRFLESRMNHIYTQIYMYMNHLQMCCVKFSAA